MAYETISISTDERGVATLLLDRADKHNAMSAQMIEELTDAAQKLGADDAVRVVILTGDGKSFCAGGRSALDAGPDGGGPGDPWGRGQEAGYDVERIE